MKILLDTHITIWAVLDSEELSNTARAMKSITVPLPCGRLRSSIWRIWKNFYTVGNIWRKDAKRMALFHCLYLINM